MQRKRDWIELIGAFLAPIVLIFFGSLLFGLVVYPVIRASFVGMNAVAFYQLFLVGPVFGIVAGLALRPRAIVAAGLGTTLGYALDFRYVPPSAQLSAAMTAFAFIGFAIAAGVVYGVRILVARLRRASRASATAA